MSLTTPIVLLLAIPLVIWAIRRDSRQLASKTPEELAAMLAANDWKAAAAARSPSPLIEWAHLSRRRRRK